MRTVGELKKRRRVDESNRKAAATTQPPKPDGRPCRSAPETSTVSTKAVKLFVSSLKAAVAASSAHTNTAFERGGLDLEAEVE